MGQRRSRSPGCGCQGSVACIARASRRSMSPTSQISSAADSGSTSPPTALSSQKARATSRPRGRSTPSAPTVTRNAPPIPSANASRAVPLAPASSGPGSPNSVSDAETRSRPPAAQDDGRDNEQKQPRLDRQREHPDRRELGRRDEVRVDAPGEDGRGADADRAEGESSDADQECDPAEPCATSCRAADPWRRGGHERLDQRRGRKVDIGRRHRVGGHRVGRGHARIRGHVIGRHRLTPSAGSLGRVGQCPPCPASTALRCSAMTFSARCDGTSS